MKRRPPTPPAPPAGWPFPQWKDGKRVIPKIKRAPKKDRLDDIEPAPF